jgi:two-component system nitrogen regulation response regulator NtrX
MPARMQAKLLRVLEQEEVIPVGDTFPVKVDVRILSATNRNLKEAVEAGTFREDLYYRLSAFPIRVPALRDRREDIPLLASRFVSVSAERHQRRIEGIDRAAVALLTNFDWPGNVRQLRNEIDCAVALARDGETISVSHLSDNVRGETNGHRTRRTGVTTPQLAPATEVESNGTDSPQVPLREARAAFEKRHIAAALRRLNGNVSRTAEALGISRPALQEKMKAYGLR